MSELHLFVIWERARYKLEEILADIDVHFIIVRQFDIYWSPEKVAINFSKFYGAKLEDVDEKVRLCGGGCFRLVVVEDTNPTYAARQTSRGVEVVNVNMFDAKTRYRQWTDGGHQIHATNSCEEMRHDYTLLTGERARDIDVNSRETSVCSLHKNVMGVDSWESVKQLFFVLNETVPYVILRGQKQILEDYFPEEHRDVDILVPNCFYENAIRIIGGIPDCNPDRPHQRIIINGETYYIDIWRTENYYFDPQWELCMIKHRQIENGLMVLSEEDNFYALLYHCVITKGALLSDYAQELYRHIGHKVSFDDICTILVDFLRFNHYEIVNPTQDDSITIHLDNPIIKQYALRHGEYIKGAVLCEDNMWVVCKVFEKTSSFVKLGTPWLIENEISKLHLLKGNSRVPQVLYIGKEGNESFVEISEVKGVDALSFFQNKKNNRPRIIRQFVMTTLKLLADFYQKRIIHRDFIPQNILVTNDGGAHIIDFGWAISYDEIDNCAKPKYLAHTDDGIYQAIDGCCDYYAFGKFIKSISKGKICYLDKIADVAMSVKCVDYKNIQRIHDFQSKLECLSQMRLLVRDRFELFLFRHKRIAKYYHKCVNKIKKVL